MVTTTERNIGGKAVAKQARQSIGDRFTLMQPQKERLAPFIPQMMKKKKKPKTKAAKQGLNEYSIKYNAVSELASANSNLTFGQLIGGDGEKAKTDIGRLSSRGARLQRNVTAVTAANARPRRLKVVQTKVDGSSLEALSDSGALLIVISPNLCKGLDLEIRRRAGRCTMANGQ